MTRLIIGILFISLFFVHCSNVAASEDQIITDPKVLKIGAENMEQYLPLLKGQRVGMVVNHTAVVNQTHLVDTLKSLGVNITAVFAPEHGFRGEADAGAVIEDGKDLKTGIEIRSLYGKTKKPTPEMLADIDILLFDIQDVGVRFYTYISTMHYTMEAAAEHDIDYIVLDRPNPNGSYADGPVREDDQKSFVGMHPIPIVHGLTIGELATMINSEKWLEGGITCNLKVIKMDNYDHQYEYNLPIKPSPNLATDASILLYPSLCLFEGTVMSVGRGTYQAFQQVGHPSFKGEYDYSFTPISIPGMATKPKYMDEECFGLDLGKPLPERRFTLSYLIEFYNKFENKEKFFRNYIHLLAGTSKLKEQIVSGMSEAEIRDTWEPKLSEYKSLRKKYLLYPLD